MVDEEMSSLGRHYLETPVSPMAQEAIFSSPGPGYLETPVFSMAHESVISSPAANSRDFSASLQCSVKCKRTFKTQVIKK